MNEQIETILPAIVGLTISGLWLLYQLGGLKYLKKINDQKRILLPSLFFLTSPFIFSLPFSGAEIGNFTKSKSVSSVITILTTTASIYTANWFLDGYRKKQKQEEIARILVASLEEQKFYLGKIIKSAKTSAQHGEKASLRDDLNKYIAFIENNDIYTLAINQIGIFPAEVIKEITRYASGLKRLIYPLKRILKKKQPVALKITSNYEMMIYSTKLDACLCLMILSKQVIGDEKLFDRLKEGFEGIIVDYLIIKNNNKDPKERIPEFQQSLENIEKVFEELGIVNEVNDYCHIKVFEGFEGVGLANEIND